MRRGLFLVLITFVWQISCFETSNLSLKEREFIDEMVLQTVTEIYQSFNEIPGEKFISEDGRRVKAFGLYFENDIDDKFYNRTKELFTKTRLRVYEKDRVEQLLQEQAIQMQDFYSKKGRLKIGQLSQWKGILIGNVKTQEMDKFPALRRLYVEVTCDFINLETGELIWSTSTTNSNKLEPSMGVLFVLMLPLLVVEFFLGKYLDEGGEHSDIAALAMLSIIITMIYVLTRHFFFY